MDKNDYEIIAAELAYDGYFQIEKLRLRHRMFAGGCSGELDRELIGRGSAAAALLYDPLLEKAVMIEQFRVGVVKSNSSPWLIEIVAGIIEVDDENAAAVVQRETKEETGLEVLALEHIQDYWVSPGSSTQQMSLYCARVDASKASGIHGNKHEGEDIKLHVFKIEDLFEDLKQRRFDNAMTVIAIQWLQLNHQELKHKWSKI